MNAPLGAYLSILRECVSGFVVKCRVASQKELYISH
jgi:hypothetical protein